MAAKKNKTAVALDWQPFTVRLGDLVPNPENPKSSDDETVSRLNDSIDTLGQFETLAVDSDGVSAVDGHQRLNAWIEAKGPDFIAKAMKANRPLTDEEKRKVILYSGKGTHGQWDFEMLEENFSMDELTDWGGFDADQFSFEEEKTEGLTDDDSVPDAPKDPVTVLGDIWLMGDHRLICGDSQYLETVEKVCNGNVMDFCFTSPPYNGETSVGFKQGRKGGMKTTTLYQDNKTDSKTSEEYIQFNSDVVGNLSVVGTHDFVCCYNISYNKKSPDTYIDVAYKVKEFMPLVETIVWEKQMAISLAGDNLTRIVEFIFVFCRGQLKINKEFRETLRNLWKVSNVGANTETHKACFPVKLVEDGIRNFAPHKAQIIEPFSGSGTTIIASEKTGCICNAIELSPSYTDVAVNRWQDYTGKEATLESTGQTFAEVKAERG